MKKETKEPIFQPWTVICTPDGGRYMVIDYSGEMRCLKCSFVEDDGCSRSQMFGKGIYCSSLVKKKNYFLKV